MVDEEEGEGDDKSAAVAEDKVLPFLSFKGLGIVLLEQGKVDIYGHSEVPEGVGGNEPVWLVRRVIWQSTFGEKAYIWIRKPWNWQRCECWPSRMGDSDISVATLHNVFPHDA